MTVFVLNLKTNLVKTYRQEWSIKLIVSSLSKVKFQVCKDCDKVCDKHQGPAIRSRTRERKRVIFMGHINSLLIQHCLTTTTSRSLTAVPNGKRLSLEAWHSVRKHLPEHLHSWHLQGLWQSQVTFLQLFLKHSFAFASNFIAEESYSILMETSSHKRFLGSDNSIFISYYYHAWPQP